jgi:purine-binding chemotaxis protein CheW
MELQLVVFKLADEDFGVPIEQVREIIRLVQITHVPKAPSSVLGVINLRGKVIPVISLRDRFGLKKDGTDESTRIIVSDVGSQNVGFVVDAVTEVLRLDESSVEAAPERAAGVDSAFIKGIGKVEDRLIIVLDLEKVFDLSALQELAS